MRGLLVGSGMTWAFTSWGPKRGWGRELRVPCMEEAGVEGRDPEGAGLRIQSFTHIVKVVSGRLKRGLV